MSEIKQKKSYVIRQYLNPEDHPGTGDVYCYCGDFPDDENPSDRNTFFSVSDCHAKARLHVMGGSKKDKTDFINKLKILEDVTHQFRIELEKRWDEEIR